MAITANVEQVIATFRSQLGYRESPAGSNRTKYGQWYGLNGAPWCFIGLSWMFAHSGYTLPNMGSSKGGSYCPAALDYAKKTRTWKGKSNPKRGDLVLFSFGGSRADHIGIVQHVIPGGVNTLECNTGSRGGSVLEQNRRSKILGYIDVRNVGTPVRGSVAPAAAPSLSSIDWAAVRRMSAAQAFDTLSRCPNVSPKQSNLYVSAYKIALNIVGNARLDQHNTTYDLKMVEAVLNFKRWMNALGANITDPDGYAREGIRWWLCVALKNIAEGKA